VTRERCQRGKKRRNPLSRARLLVKKTVFDELTTEEDKEKPSPAPASAAVKPAAKKGADNKSGDKGKNIKDNKTASKAEPTKPEKKEVVKEVEKELVILEKKKKAPSAKKKEEEFSAVDEKKKKKKDKGAKTNAEDGLSLLTVGGAVVAVGMLVAWFAMK